MLIELVNRLGRLPGNLAKEILTGFINRFEILSVNLAKEILTGFVDRFGKLSVNLVKEMLTEFVDHFEKLSGNLWELERRVTISWPVKKKGGYVSACGEFRIRVINTPKDLIRLCPFGKQYVAVMMAHAFEAVLCVYTGL
ncbi:hypothetical protein Nepgr_001242 [Nepenthes gracilis]|uniref:Uncharacterized protein n=1 Tax=Nepenthes gracilis TaxID=150966 RepID=A0AAD3RXF1_NEPGR|nr:hypothetical protein Nepgr_001242 [Nepenthes gracilis]